MDPQVAQTLAALEHKLAELERELRSIGKTSPEPTAGVLVDEAVEQRFSMESRETVYGEIPATKDRHEAIDIADLVRFKETMQRTLQGLIDQYSRLLSIEPPSHD